MKSIFLVVAVWICVASAAFGYGGGAGAFLSLGTSARALGMGGAFTSVCDDASAIYWNPAGLARMRSSELMFSYGLLFEDRKQSFLAYNQPLGLVSLGLGWLNYGIGGISGRDEYGQPTGDITDSENAFMFAFTLRHGLVIEGFDIYPGLGIKYLYQSLAGYQATGLGKDFGLMARREMDQWGLRDVAWGGTIQNMAASLKWNTMSEHEDRVPVTYKFGGKIGLSLLPVVLAIDYENVPNQNLSCYHAGSECAFGFLTLRGGWSRGNWTGGLSVDASIVKKRFRLHYGFSTDPISANGIHRIGLSYIGPAPARKPIKITPPPPETTVVARVRTEIREVARPQTLVIDTPERPSIHLDPIYFGLNSFEIRHEEEPFLKVNAVRLQEQKALKVLVIGHTSDEGSQDYNVRLGMKRALAIKDYLVRLGISEDRFFIISRGFAEPGDIENPAQNRRVTFEVQ